MARPEGKKRLQEYYEALGRFIDMVAQIETVMAFTLWHYAKIPPEIAKVIFAGARIEISTTYIKQIAEATATPKELRDDLEYVFQQLGMINVVRNHVVHYGASSIAEGHGIVSNSLKAKKEPIVFPISPKALNEMTADLRKIVFHLRYRHYSGDTTLGNEPGRQILDDVLQSPWLYKHPSQTNTPSKKAGNQSSQKRVPKHPRPQKSSPA